ncbi:glucose-6-phosphate dehydrogenase (coenzyme-F420) [Lapillicoccus jejuensis]
MQPGRAGATGRARVGHVPGLKVGYKAPSDQADPRSLLAHGVLAERLGFDSVFVSDHLQPARHDGGHAPFAPGWLGALGASTQRVTIGTSVLTPTFRYHPAVVAQAFATLGHLFPGRVVLGLGSGEALNEAPLGGRWPDGRERFARLREAVAVIRALWTQDRVDYRGEYYRLERATVYDRPETPVPIWLASSGPGATRFAGAHADGWVTTSGKDPSLYRDTLVPALAAGAADAGRTLGDLDLMVEVKVSFDPDPQRALEATRAWAPLALSPDQRAGTLDPVELERLAADLGTDRTARRVVVSSDPDEHVERLRTYVDLGFTHLVVHSPDPDQAGFLERYGREVLPLLRGLG